MGLWLIAPLALFVAILLWDREKLFTLEKSFALLNILAATPWCVTLGINAELFPDWSFRAGWYLAIPELVIGAMAVVTGLWFARSNRRKVEVTAAGGATVAATGGATGGAGAGVRDTMRWAEKLLGAGPWLLGYGVILSLLMLWARNRI
ncbi:MAG: hypothetical protein IMX00_00010 [Limnochordales bacterium]|nr:hypothetical protein [Limnochordales bacterium]